MSKALNVENVDHASVSGDPPSLLKPMFVDVAGLTPDDLQPLCHRLLGDLVGRPIGFEKAVEGGPIFLIRSACPELFQSFLENLYQRFPDIEVHVVSHVKDRSLVESTLREPYRYFEYETEGPYSFKELSSSMPFLAESQYQAKVMLDYGGFLHRLDEVLKIVDWVPGERSLVWSGVGPTLLELGTPELRAASHEALMSLSRWVDANF